MAHSQEPGKACEPSGALAHLLVLIQPPLRGLPPDSSTGEGTRREMDHGPVTSATELGHLHFTCPGHRALRGPVLGPGLQAWRQLLSLEGEAGGRRGRSCKEGRRAVCGGICRRTRVSKEAPSLHVQNLSTGGRQRHYKTPSCKI